MIAPPYVMRILLSFLVNPNKLPPFIAYKNLHKIDNKSPGVRVPAQAYECMPILLSRANLIVTDIFHSYAKNDFEMSESKSVKY